MEEQVQEVPQEQPQEQEVNVDALIETLEKAGITDSKALEGKFEASKQAGNLANQLGDARAEIAKLREMMESNQAQPQQNVQKNEFDMDNYGEGQTINLQEEIAKGVKRVFTDMQKTQMQAQQQAAQVANAIQRDRFYPAVKELWEARCADPNFIMQVQSGRTNPIAAYKDLVIEFQGNLLSQSTDVIKKTRGTVAPPNVETSGTRGQQQGNLVSEKPSEDSPQRQKEKELLEKINKGYRPSDDEVIDTYGAAMDEIFSG